MTASDSADGGTDALSAPVDRAAAPAIHPIAYAPPELFKRRMSPVDGMVLFFGIAQFAVALLVAVSGVWGSRGYYELRDPTWWKWLAWQAQGGQWSIWAWALASLGAIVGAIRPPGYRRRWYLGYATTWVVAVVACIAALAVLSRVRDESRWVSTFYGTPMPQEWKENRVRSSFFWQLPFAMTITNPLVVLFAFRASQGRFPEGDPRQVPAS